jgi:hypothetical protein
MLMFVGLALSLATPALVQQPELSGDWWWVAGDSKAEAAVFVNGESARRTGETASITAVRIARDGTPSDFSWHGRCADRHADDEIAAVARFACGTDADHVQNAALLGGLSPAEAARAIFQVSATRPRSFAPASSLTVG